MSFWPVYRSVTLTSCNPFWMRPCVLQLALTNTTTWRHHSRISIGCGYWSASSTSCAFWFTASFTVRWHGICPSWYCPSPTSSPTVGVHHRRCRSSHTMKHHRRPCVRSSSCLELPAARCALGSVWQQFQETLKVIPFPALLSVIMHRLCICWLLYGAVEAACTLTALYKSSLLHYIHMNTSTLNIVHLGLYTVFQKKFTPRTFMITVWNENQFK